jgi:Rod binding domain-containing protein
VRDLAASKGSAQGVLDRLVNQLRDEEAEPGERYGWWEDHEPEDTHEVAMVHGAVNDVRTKILLDTGASVSMLSFDFARKLRLKLKTHKQLKGVRTRRCSDVYHGSC